MEPGLIWILGGLLLLAAELALPGVFLLWVGLAAIGTGIVVLAVLPPIEGVAAVFLVLLGGSVALALRLRARRPASQVNAPGAGLVGRHGTLLPMDGPEIAGADRRQRLAGPAAARRAGAGGADAGAGGRGGRHHAGGAPARLNRLRHTATQNNLRCRRNPARRVTLPACQHNPQCFVAAQHSTTRLSSGVPWPARGVDHGEHDAAAGERQSA